MEKTEKEIKTIEKYKHHFYCDSCSEFLGTVEEYEDGWYQNLGEFELKFFVANKWYRLSKCLCDDCATNLINNIKSILEGIGFKED